MIEQGFAAERRGWKRILEEYDIHTREQFIEALEHIEEIHHNLNKAALLWNHTHDYCENVPYHISRLAGE